MNIEKISDEEIKVNGKTCYKDIDGKWRSLEELTLSEEKELKQFLNSAQ
ncbi:MAG: hypothetical protein WCY77_10060 [Weeksellaceae bacterium]